MRRPFALAPIALSAALALAACGGGDRQPAAQETDGVDVNVPDVPVETPTVAVSPSQDGDTATPGAMPTGTATPK